MFDGSLAKITVRFPLRCGTELADNKTSAFAISPVVLPDVVA